MTLLKHSPLAIEFKANGKRKYPHGRDQLFAWLRARREVGVHSREAGVAGLTNPSQYAGDIVREGVQVMQVSELPPGASKGVRWFLPDFAPKGAVASKPSAERNPLKAVPAPEPEPVPAPRRRHVDHSAFTGDLFGEAPPIDISYSDREAA